MKPKSSPRNSAEDSPRRAAPKPHAARGPSQRQLRVGEEIRHVLADLFLRTEFHDAALTKEHITISEVRMSPDLKHALVFATVLGQKDITPLLPALKRVAPFLRSQIAPRLGLRVTPELKFVADEALEQATKINRLLHNPQVARDLARDVEGKGSALNPPGPEAPDPH